MSKIIIPFRANLSANMPFENAYSMAFDGVDDYVETSSVINLGTTYSISFWLKTTQSLTSNGCILAAGGGNGFTMLLLRNNRLMLYRGSAGSYNYTNAGLSFNDGNWHNIILTRNGTDTVNFYIDGVDETYLTAGSDNLDSQFSFIGDDGGTWGTAVAYNGGLDEISFFNEVKVIGDIWDGTGKPTDLTGQSGLVAWYRNGDNGSWKSPQWLIPSNENKDKVSNYSMDFDGIDDSVQIISSTGTLGFGDISYSSWIKTTQVGVYQQYRTAFGGRSNGGSAHDLGKLGTPYNSSNMVVAGGAGTVPLNDGVWHHLATTFNNTTKETIFYVDGVVDRVSTYPAYITHFGIAIGTNGYNLGYPFEGSVDGCSVHQGVLTQSEVTSIHNNGVPTDLMSLSPYGWWKAGEEATFIPNSPLDGNGVWTIPDLAGSNNGISTNLMADTARVGNAPSSSKNALSFNMDEVDRITDVPI